MEVIKPHKKYPYTWEQAIEVLREDKAHQELIFNAYLTENLLENCERFYNSEEFSEVLTCINLYTQSKKLLDIPSGNGIATYAFAKAGFDVTAVDPNPSITVGRRALEHSLSSAGLSASVIDAYGESLPFTSESFDVVYVRQGLHHAANLSLMLREYARVLKPNGVLIATREHVVDNYEDSLQAFLDSQVDHQLYGGENAFTLKDYRHAIKSAGLNIIQELPPFASKINLFPITIHDVHQRILSSVPGKLLLVLFSKDFVINIGIWLLNKKKIPGRLYSFIAKKEN